MGAKQRLVVLAFLVIACAAIGWAAQNVDANTVLVAATVTADKNAFAHGLKEENFQLTEENSAQKLTFFSPDNSPASISIIVGAGATTGRTDRVTDSIKSAVETFQKTGHPNSQYFIDGFGKDGLNGAVMRGLDRLKMGAHPRKVLLVILDSLDDPGGNPDQPSMDGPLKQEVPISFIFLSGTNSSTGRFSQNWLTVMEDVSKTSGGKMLFAEPLQELQAECIKLAEELKNQYLLGYHSSNTAQDGKWRKLAVKVTPPAGQKLNIRTKARYFVAKSGK